RQWGLTASQTGWLTAAVQAGFVAGTATAAVLNLADVIPSRWYFAGSATLGAVVNAALLAAPTYAVALVSRFLTGFCLAGVYPPAMKMIATWFSSGRGLAIGTVVGALTVGKAVPYLAHALAGSRVGPVVGVVSGGRLGCGSDRARAAPHPGHGGERQLRRSHRRFLCIERLGHGRRRMGVGVLRHRRFGAVQHDGHEIGAAARGGDCADSADVVGISAHDGEHSARSAARRPRR